MVTMEGNPSYGRSDGELWYGREEEGEERRRGKATREKEGRKGMHGEINRGCGGGYWARGEGEGDEEKKKRGRAGRRKEWRKMERKRQYEGFWGERESAGERPVQGREGRRKHTRKQKGIPCGAATGGCELNRRQREEQWK